MVLSFGGRGLQHTPDPPGLLKDLQDKLFPQWGQPFNISTPFPSVCHIQTHRRQVSTRGFQQSHVYISAQTSPVRTKECHAYSCLFSHNSLVSEGQILS